MKCYRLKHLPTGMYFRPSRGGVKIKRSDGKTTYVKTNLSKKGKIYAGKPSLHWLGVSFYSHLRAQELFESDTNKVYTQYRIYGVLPVLDSEWIIEEVKDEVATDTNCAR